MPLRYYINTLLSLISFKALKSTMFPILIVYWGLPNMSGIKALNNN